MFPSSFALTLHIYFYLNLKESPENALWIVIALKSAILVHPKLLSKLCIFCDLSKTGLKISRKSWWSCLFWWNISALQMFLSFCMLHLLLLEKTPKPCMAGEKLCLWSPTFIFFPPKHFRLFIFVEKTLLEFFFV